MEVKEMTDKELFEYVEERKRQAESQRSIAKELNMGESTLRAKLKRHKETIEQIGTSNKIEKTILLPKNDKVQRGTDMNAEFSQNDISTLKQLIKEHESTKAVVEKYKIYDELSKVPVNAETVRSAFNMSKDTTERLKKYAGERRLPLQDIVELAVINLLEQYDKK